MYLTLLFIPIKDKVAFYSGGQQDTQPFSVCLGSNTDIHKAFLNNIKRFQAIFLFIFKIKFHHYYLDTSVPFFTKLSFSTILPPLNTVFLDSGHSKHPHTFAQAAAFLYWPNFHFHSLHFHFIVPCKNVTGQGVRDPFPGILHSA